MVLWLKPWESRSLPGLPRTKQFLFTCHDQKNAAFPSEGGVFLCSVAQAREPMVFSFGHDWRALWNRVHGPFISKSVRSPALGFQTAPTEETPMREFIRPAIAALSIACLAASMASFRPTAHWRRPSSSRWRRPRPRRRIAPVKQMALTEKQIQGVLAASTDMDAITEKLPENAKPDPKVIAQLDACGQEERLCQLRRIQQCHRQYQPGACGLRSGDQEICRLRSRHQGADRPGPGRQEDVGQGQEGCARRSQRGAEDLRRRRSRTRAISIS